MKRLDEVNVILDEDNLSWQPNSDKIALAFRNGVLSTQFYACTANNRYQHVAIQNVPENILIDNGKDYRSKYTFIREELKKLEIPNTQINLFSQPQREL
jgi:hypothetical protein